MPLPITSPADGCDGHLSTTWPWADEKIEYDASTEAYYLQQDDGSCVNVEWNEEEAAWLRIETCPAVDQSRSCGNYGQWAHDCHQRKVHKVKGRGKGKSKGRSGKGGDRRLGRSKSQASHPMPRGKGKGKGKGDADRSNRRTYLSSQTEQVVHDIDADANLAGDESVNVTFAGGVEGVFAALSKSFCTDGECGTCDTAEGCHNACNAVAAGSDAGSPKHPAQQTLMTVGATEVVAPRRSSDWRQRTRSAASRFTAPIPTASSASQKRLSLSCNVQRAQGCDALRGGALPEGRPADAASHEYRADAQKPLDPHSVPAPCAGEGRRWPLGLARAAPSPERTPVLRPPRSHGACEPRHDAEGNDR